MMDLFEIVAERPLAEVPTDAPTCPDCNRTPARETYREQTLLGWSGKGWSPNHTWSGLECGCGAIFVREWKSGNVWYTRERVEGRVLRGMPSCFERYTYTCAKCSGPVRREYKQLDGSPLHGGLLTTKDGPQYLAEYRCRVCNHGGRVERDYWTPAVAPPFPEKQLSQAPAEPPKP
jgi:hypothetical protein